MTATAYQANINAANEQRNFNELQAKLDRLEAGAAEAPALTDELVNEIARTRLAIELATPRLERALATREQADAAIDSTDDGAADALLELLLNNKNELGLWSHSMVKRKRPGKKVPMALPEICVSQQENSRDEGGIFTVKRLFLTIYAVNEGGIGFDFAKLNAVVSQMPQFKLAAVGNTAPVEKLDGGAVRKCYVLEGFTGHNSTPAISTPLTAATINHVARTLTEKIRTHSQTGTHGEIVEGSAKVVSDGPQRSVQFDLDVRLDANYLRQNSSTVQERVRRIAESWAGSGRVIAGLGRVTGATVDQGKALNDRGGRFTVLISAEAQIS